MFDKIGKENPLGSSGGPKGSKVPIEFKETTSMNLANIGPFNGASFMACDAKEHKCPMSFFEGEPWQKNLGTSFACQN
jgi:hypothetical protein